MNGRVFELHVERRNKSQFPDTMEALIFYTSTAYNNDINYLNILFTELKVSTIKEPKDPVETTTTNKSGITTKSISKLQEMVHNKKLKQRIKNESILVSAIRSLYNIVVGQCSKLMRNKPIIMRGFATMETDGDLTTLLKEIRTIILQIETNTSVYDAWTKQIIYTIIIDRKITRVTPNIYATLKLLSKRWNTWDWRCSPKTLLLSMRKRRT